MERFQYKGHVAQKADGDSFWRLFNIGGYYIGKAANLKQAKKKMKDYYEKRYSRGNCVRCSEAEKLSQLSS